MKNTLLLVFLVGAISVLLAGFAWYLLAGLQQAFQGEDEMVLEGFSASGDSEMAAEADGAASGPSFMEQLREEEPDWENIFEPGGPLDPADINDDRRLSKDEFMRFAKEEIRKEIPIPNFLFFLIDPIMADFFEDMDANGDGFVTQDEMHGIMPPEDEEERQQWAKERLERR